MALITFRFFTELQWDTKHKETPGKIASLFQGLCVGLWIMNDMYYSAIASTFLYFIWDYAINVSLGKDKLETQIHHLIGMALCFYSLDTSSYLKSNIEGDITRTLILMETTNISFQAAFVLYNEFGYTHMMIPAMIHFFVVRVLCLGHFINPLNPDLVVIINSRFMAALWAITFTMWMLQVAWISLWVKHTSKKYGAKLD